VATLSSVSSVCQRTPAERDAVDGRLAAAESDFSGSVQAALERWFTGTDVDPVTVKQIEATLLANDVRSYVNCYRVFAHADAEIAPELSQIAAPALAITGELDPGSTPEMTHRLAAALPRCETVIVPGARHMLPLQTPQPLIDSLVSFIGGQS
jgi:pimeloyl-ACP methyl ester carboxylesterase